MSPLTQALQSPYIKNTLKILNLSYNNISEAHVENLPGLFALDISYNQQLTEVHFQSVPCLRMLDLRYCAVDDVGLLNMFCSDL